jgi:hypothetical protein
VVALRYLLGCVLGYAGRNAGAGIVTSYRIEQVLEIRARILKVIGLSLAGSYRTLHNAGSDIETV